MNHCMAYGISGFTISVMGLGASKQDVSGSSTTPVDKVSTLSHITTVTVSLSKILYTLVNLIAHLMHG